MDFVMPSSRPLLRPKCRRDPSLVPSFLPNLRPQGQLVQFLAGFAPRWVVLGKQGHKPFAVGGLEQVEHLVHDHVLQKVFRLLHELGVEADVPRPVIAASPLRLHALEEVAGNTNAELRLLPLLPTYLSFQEIADRLLISRNTVKTHAMSIYGKLQASSRGEAVERAVELGLVEPYPGLESKGRPAAN